MKTDQPAKLIQEYLKILLPQYPVELAYLYGSAASSKTTQFSDIDIALIVDSHAIPPTQNLRLELMIEDAIAQQCKLSNADVRVINNAPLALRGQVVTEGILLYAHNDLFRIEFETHTRMEYFDFQPVLERQRFHFFNSILTKGIDGKRTKSRRHVSASERLSEHLV